MSSNHLDPGDDPAPPRRGRGRPKGSRNKPDAGPVGRPRKDGQPPRNRKQGEFSDVWWHLDLNLDMPDSRVDISTSGTPRSEGESRELLIASILEQKLFWLQVALRQHQLQGSFKQLDRDPDLPPGLALQWCSVKVSNSTQVRLNAPNSLFMQKRQKRSMSDPFTLKKRTTNHNKDTLSKSNTQMPTQRVYPFIWKWTPSKLVGYAKLKTSSWIIQFSPMLVGI